MRLLPQKPLPTDRIYVGLDSFLAVTTRASHFDALRRASAAERSLLESHVVKRSQALYPIVLSEPVAAQK